jgi:hypothetical protein
MLSSSGDNRVAEADAQAVLVYLRGSGLPDELYENFDVATLEDQLEEAINSAGLGEFDGNEFGPEEIVLFMYGPNAEAIFAAIRPVLQSCPLCQGARIEIRPGGPDVIGRMESISVNS